MTNARNSVNIAAVALTRLFDETRRKSARTNARMSGKIGKMRKTNFDRYFEEQLCDPAFAAHFDAAGEAWDVSLQLANLRRPMGLSNKRSRANLEVPSTRSSRPMS
jgi:hypothetical protein